MSNAIQMYLKEVKKDNLRGYFVDKVNKNLILNTSYRILRFCSWSKSDTESTLKSIQIFKELNSIIKQVSNGYLKDKRIIQIEIVILIRDQN